MSGLNIQNNSWNGWTSSSIGTLFSGFQTTGVNGLASFVSDYSSIKNGSYGKLVKAYYEKIDSANEEEKKTAKSISDKIDYVNTLDSKKLDSNAKNAASDAKALASAANSLTSNKGNALFTKTNVTGSDGKMDYNYDMEKIYGSISSFVEAYNKVLDQTDKVDSETMDRAISSMLNTTRINSKALTEIGVNINSDSKLSIDKSTFLNADVSAIKKLFNGSSSYASVISKQADSISASIVGTNGYNSTGSYNASSYDFFSQYI
ncbi:MAG: hypothetical protein K5851_00105 [Lachnospiraceae bacterium]|nr:hypothetical protein [Lachnospiraceae bacterium]